jgi:hypothetical protein
MTLERPMFPPMAERAPVSINERLKNSDQEFFISGNPQPARVKASPIGRRGLLHATRCCDRTQGSSARSGAGDVA